MQPFCELLAEVKALLDAADQGGQIEIGRSFAGRNQAASCFGSHASHDGLSRTN